MRASSSLNSQADWLQMLRSLGLRVNSNALPVRLACPTCQTDALTLFKDSINGGCWHYCRACQEGGDLWSFASKVLKLPLADTIQALISRGLIAAPPAEKLTAYLQTEAHEQQKLRTKWQHACDLFYRYAPARQLLAQWQMPIDLPEERWTAGPGMLYGVAPKLEVESWFYPDFDPNQPHARERRSKVFSGTGWDIVVASPCYRLPGQISGFLLIGRNGDPAQDVVWQQLDFCGSKRSGSPGLYGWPSVVETPSRWENQVVAVSDPLLNMRLQIRHFWGSRKPLPLVSWCREQTPPETWQLLAGRSLVFWSPDKGLTCDVLEQAIAANGRISLVGPSVKHPEALLAYLRDRPSEHILRHVIEDAKPWAKATALALRHMPDDDARPIVEFLDDRDLLDQVLPLVHHTRTRALKELLPTRLTGTQVVVGYTRFTIQGDTVHSISNKKKHVLVMDAVLQLDSVVVQAGEVYYQGVIRFHGETIPFRERKHVLENRLVSWTQEQIIKSGKGLLRSTPTRHRSDSLLEVFQRWHPPKVLPSLDRVGWDEESRSFLLPYLRIGEFGEIEPRQTPVHVEMPCAVRTAAFPTPEEWRGLTDQSPETQLYWALMIAMLGTILAPGRGRAPRGIAVEGEHLTRFVRHVALQAGCLDHTIDRYMFNAGRLLDREKLHNWPTHFRRRTLSRELFAQWLTMEEPLRYGLTCVNRLQGVSALLKGTWVILKPPAGAQDDFEAPGGDKLVLGYLMDLCRRGVPLEAATGVKEWYQTIACDLSKYVDRAGGEGGVVLAAAACIETSTTNSFTETLCLAYANGHLRLVPEGFASGSEPAIFYDDQTMRIEQAELVKLFEANFATPPSPQCVARELAQANWLLESPDDRESWIISRAAWEARLAVVVPPVSPTALRLYEAG